MPIEPHPQNCYTCHRLDCNLIKRKAENQTFAEILEDMTDPDMRETMKVIAGMMAMVGCCCYLSSSVLGQRAVKITNELCQRVRDQLQYDPNCGCAECRAERRRRAEMTG